MNSTSGSLRSGIEYGADTTVSPDGAEELVRVVAKIHDDQPSPEHASVACWDCDRRGYATPCHSIAMEKATPTTWRTVFVCCDCASRGDPLCGEVPSDLSHPLVMNDG